MRLVRITDYRRFCSDADRWWPVGHRRFPSLFSHNDQIALKRPNRMISALLNNDSEIPLKIGLTLVRPTWSALKECLSRQVVRHRLLDLSDTRKMRGKKCGLGSLFFKASQDESPTRTGRWPHRRAEATDPLTPLECRRMAMQLFESAKNTHSHSTLIGSLCAAAVTAVAAVCRVFFPRPNASVTRSAQITRWGYSYCSMALFRIISSSFWTCGSSCHRYRAPSLRCH